MSAIVTYPDTQNRFADSKKITLDKILQGGGGSGGSASVTAAILAAQQVYIDRAPAAPNNPALPALSYATGGGPQQEWDVATQAWV